MDESTKITAANKTMMMNCRITCIGLLGGIFEFNLCNNVEMPIAYICCLYAPICPCSIRANRLRVDVQFKPPTIC